MATSPTHNPLPKPTAQDSPGSKTSPWVYRFLTFFVLAISVLLAHGWSLWDGLGIDDHWHYRTIRQSGWSPSELLDATTIRSADLFELWWQDAPVQFQYSRPLSVALMKLVYTVTDGNVFAQHAVNLTLHLLAACLVTALCTKLTSHRFWSVAGGVLFVVYPLSVNAVGFLAAQNMVLQTVLLLGAILAYVRASQLNLNISATGVAASTLDLNHRWFALAVILWIGALFSRENAIVLPVVLLAMDVAFGGWKQAWRKKPAYLIMAVLGVAFLIWRLGFFYEPMPDVYVRRSSEPGYLLWCATKLLHYVCCAVWAAPMTVGPTGRYFPLSQAPFDVFLMLAIVTGVAIVYFAFARKARGYWIWPLWIVLLMAPVIPVLATPHSGYICGVATAIGLILGPVSAFNRKSKRTYVLATSLAIFVFIASMGMLKVNRLMWKGLLYAESFVTTQLRSQPLPTETTDVFFINLPFAAVYAKEHLVDAHKLDYDAIQCHVMTFAPQLPRMDQPSTITQLDAYRFSLRVKSQPYFSRLLGRFLIGAFREGGQLKVGDRFTGELFDVEILDANPEGVWELLFTFKKPLASPQYAFYTSSEECGAMPVKFSSPGSDSPILPDAPPAPTSLAAIHEAAAELIAGDPQSAGTLFAAIGSPMTAIQLAAAKKLKRIVKPIAIATASSVIEVFDDSRITKSEAKRLRDWWFTKIDRKTIDLVFGRRAEFEDIRQRRDELKRGRALIGKYIQCDLYLTGRPFPGP